MLIIDYTAASVAIAIIYNKSWFEFKHESVCCTLQGISESNTVYHNSEIAHA